MDVTEKPADAENESTSKTAPGTTNKNEVRGNKVFALFWFPGNLDRYRQFL